MNNNCICYLPVNVAVGLLLYKQRWYFHAINIYSKLYIITFAKYETSKTSHELDTHNEEVLPCRTQHFIWVFWGTQQHSSIHSSVYTWYLFYIMCIMYIYILYIYTYIYIYIYRIHRLLFITLYLDAGMDVNSALKERVSKVFTGTHLPFRRCLPTVQFSSKAHITFAYKDSTKMLLFPVCS